jgi:hypothetical protein
MTRYFITKTIYCFYLSLIKSVYPFNFNFLNKKWCWVDEFVYYKSSKYQLFGSRKTSK